MSAAGMTSFVDAIWPSRAFRQYLPADLGGPGISAWDGLEVEGREEREARKAEELAHYIEQALERKQYLRPLSDEEIPVVPASRAREAFYYKN